MSVACIQRHLHSLVRRPNFTTGHKTKKTGHDEHLQNWTDLKNELSVSSEPGGEDGRQGQGLVEGIGVKRLGAAEDCGHRLHARANDVVVRVLLGQRPA